MKIKFEYKITLAYLILGGLWIVFSDKIVYYFIPNGLKLTTVQTFKGWFFVIATATLFFSFIKKHLTKKRKADFELKNKTEEYYSLYEEYKSQTEGRFAFVNKALCDMYGANSENELLNQDVLERAHPDFVDYIKERIQTLNEKREQVSKSEYKHLKLNGEPIDIEVMAVPFKYESKNGALVFIRDITSVKQYINEIKEKNTFIQTVLDNLPIGIALNKANKGVATYINKKFEEIYGWPAESLKDIKTFFEKVYPDEDYRKQITTKILTDIQSGKPENMHWENIEITQQNGDKRIINALNIPLIKQNTMVSTVMDITDQKMFENELVIAKEKAEESNRLKSAFLNNISHEFRTPLNGMLGFLNLALQEDLSPEKKSEYYKIIKKSSNQFLNILTDVIEISEIQSKIDNTKIAACNLKEVIDKVIRDKKEQVIQKNLELELTIDCSEEELQIQTDYHRIERSLMHILDNAIKFTHKGNIALSCKRSNNNEIEISVKDSGIGISPSEQKMIFEPFRQIELGENRSYGGNGIGLSLVKFYIESLGGTVNLESELKKGTSIVLKMPAKK